MRKFVFSIMLSTTFALSPGCGDDDSDQSGDDDSGGDSDTDADTDSDTDADTDSDTDTDTDSEGVWQIRIIDSYGSFGNGNSLALDSAGNVRISYAIGYSVDADDFYKLKYASNETGQWEAIFLIPDEEFGGGSLASLAVDSEGKNHISHSDPSAGFIKYSTDATGTWQHQSVDQARGWQTSLGLDRDGAVHISYQTDQSQLGYATNASGAWVLTTLDSSVNVGHDNSIAVDSLGHVHISYFGGPDDDLKYATNASGQWVVSTLDSEGAVGVYTSIGMGSDDSVHISYYDHSNADLKYATNASGDWVFSVIDSQGDVGQYTSIAVDNNDRIHISYYDLSNTALKYATNARGAWVLETVDSQGPLGCPTSIAVDSENRPHISYIDFGTNDLKYATIAR